MVSGFTHYIRTSEETETNSETMTTNPTVSELRHEMTSRLREIAACVGTVTAGKRDLVEELEGVQKHIIALDSLTRILGEQCTISPS